jgi:hypothetical protein
VEQPADRVIRSSSPFEVLSLAEHTLGFRPRESLLLVSLRPPRWRTGVVGRVDVAAADHPEVVDALVRHVVADGAGRCFVALVTDEGDAPPLTGRTRHGLALVPAPRDGGADAAGAGAGAQRPAGARRPAPARPRRPAPLTGLLRLPASARAERVCAALVDAGVEPEPWLLHRGRLYSYSCDLSCCPPEGLPLDRLGATRVAAEMVLAGRVLPADRAGWEQGLLRAVTPAAGTGGTGGPGGPPGSGGPGDGGDPAVADALTALGRGRPPAPRAVRSAWRRLLAEEAAAPGAADRLAARDAAELLDALRRLPLRDQLLAVAAPQALPELAPALAPAADPDAALAVLQQLARRAPVPWRAAATGCAAYLAWCTGSSPAAGVWAEAALALDPGHSLSALVLQAVSIGMPPPGREEAGGSVVAGA